MRLVEGSPRIVAAPDSDPTTGQVVWSKAKSAWLGCMTLATLTFAPVTFGFAELTLFITTAALTLCAGHSVGMHRRLIHNSFECPRWLEYVLIYLGVLVGMAGPFGMIRQHDIRDWAQRQTACHSYLRHGQGIVEDYFWQCHCDLQLEHAPRLAFEKRLAVDQFYLWMERTWMLQQAPIALLFYLWGGWSFVIWGVAARVAVCVTGHWLIGYFAHHEDRQATRNITWTVRNAAVQGRDVPVAGLISMGESWHNNHHAFPGSAKIGLLSGQPDPGWWFIKVLETLGLAWNIVTPDKLPVREELARLNEQGTGWSICRFRRRMWQDWFGIA